MILPTLFGAHAARGLYRLYLRCRVAVLQWQIGALLELKRRLQDDND